MLKLLVDVDDVLIFPVVGKVPETTIPPKSPILKVPPELKVKSTLVVLKQSSIFVPISNVVPFATTKAILLKLVAVAVIVPADFVNV